MSKLSLTGCRKEEKVKESDLFAPLKDYFEGLGCQIEGEVKNCDALVKMGEDYLALELKKDLNLKVILQAVERQKIFELVYIAVSTGKINLAKREFKEKVNLLKRLGIGLFLVNLHTREVSLYQQPIEAGQRQLLSANKKKREAFIREFEKRILKNNVGGVNQQPITTYYREQCYQVAYWLKDGARSAAQIAKEGLNHKLAYRILYQNHYGWFAKESKGKYCLSDEGRKMLAEKSQIVESLMQELLRNS